MTLRDFLDYPTKLFIDGKTEQEEKDLEELRRKLRKEEEEKQLEHIRKWSNNDS